MYHINVGANGPSPPTEPELPVPEEPALPKLSALPVYDFGRRVDGGIPLHDQLPLGPDLSEWGNLGFSEHNLIFQEGEAKYSTPFKAIFRDGRLVTISSNSYKLIPHERVIEAVTEAATTYEGEHRIAPFHEFKGPWYVPFRNQEAHQIMARNGRSLYSMWAIQEPFDVGPLPDGGRDKIHLGFAIKNSIDGASSLGGVVFTFRHACSNMTAIPANLKGMNFDNREVVEKMHLRHTKNLDVSIDALRLRFGLLINRGIQVINRYRELREEALNRELAEKIVKALPRKYLPESFTLDKDGNLEEFKIDDMWKVYNDITAAISHNDKLRDFASLEALSRKLHTVIQV